MLAKSVNLTNLANLRKKNLSGPVMGLLAAYVVLFIALSIISPHFFQVKNLANIGVSISVYGIAALGVTMIVFSGGLDLSVAGNMALANVVTVELLTKTDMNVYLIMLICLLTSTVVGLANGFFTTKFNLHPTIVTLGTYSVARGLAFYISGGMSLMHDSKEIKFLGSGRILGLPVCLLIFIAVLLVMYFVMRYTTFGRSIYAIGGNSRASYLAGISVNKVRMIIFTSAGLLAGIAALIITGTIGGAAGNTATGWENDIISAVLLGGTSIAGGRGSVVGTALGVLFIGTLNNGMSLLGINSYVQMILKGIVLITAIVADSMRNKKAAKV